MTEDELAAMEDLPALVAEVRRLRALLEPRLLATPRVNEQTGQLEHWGECQVCGCVSASGVSWPAPDRPVMSAATFEVDFWDDEERRDPSERKATP